jgi:hypothetical protein
MYMAQAWDCELGPGDAQIGTTRLVRSVLQDGHDWMQLAPLDVHGGVLGEQLAMITQVRQALGTTAVAWSPLSAGSEW